MDKVPWHVAFETIESYVVKIITPQGSGTGFLVALSENKNLVGIATATHVLDFAHYWEQPIRIEHAKSGETIFLNHADRFIDVDYKRDIASIVIVGGKLPLPTEPLSIIAEDKHLKVGVELGWVGFPAIAQNHLCFFSGTVSSWVGDEGFYFVDGVAINGVSGGPAFCIKDNKIQLIGVVSAYVPNRATGATLPGLCVVRDVLPLYKMINGLKSLEDAKKSETTPGEQPPPPPPAPTAAEHKIVNTIGGRSDKPLHPMLRAGAQRG